MDYLAEPLLSGIYGGDPRELSVTRRAAALRRTGQKYGSLTRGVLASRAQGRSPQRPPAPLFRTLKGGLGQMVDAVAAAIRPQPRSRSRPRADGRAHRRRASASASTATGSRPTDWCWRARRTAPPTLLAPVDARLSELLGTVGVQLVDDRGARASTPPISRSRRSGSASWFPRRSAGGWSRCTWVGTKFSHRVPEGKIVARCFLGGMDDAGVLAETDERSSRQ